MASVKLNVLANLSGNIWVALISLALIPFYIQLMGVEAYALVGVFVSLQAVFAILDLGLSQSLSREMARLSVTDDQAALMRDTARTMEVLYAAGAVLVVVVIVAASDYIAYQWLNPDSISSAAVKSAICLIGLVVGTRWPLALYVGGLNGLQRQVLLNVLMSVFATMQSVGALMALLFIEPTIEVFFIWQAIVAAVQVLVVRFYFWRGLSAGKARFSLGVLHGVWRFALGMTSISLLAVLLSQLDKLLLSRILTLQDFGYYVFASTAAAVILKLSAPLFNAFLPRFTQLVTLGDEVGLRNIYRLSCQLMGVVIVPVAWVLYFFSDAVLLLWTQDAELVSHTAVVFGLLIIGNAINGLMTLPYALQLANAWTRLAFYQNVVAVLLFFPAIYMFATEWGAVGAAVAWICLNGLYLVVGIHVMHARLLSTEKRSWYAFAVIIPGLTGFCVAAVMARLQGDDAGAVLQSVIIILASIVVFFLTALSMPEVRKIMFLIAGRFFSKGNGL